MNSEIYKRGSREKPDEVCKKRVTSRKDNDPEHRSIKQCLSWSGSGLLTAAGGAPSDAAEAEMFTDEIMY